MAKAVTKICNFITMILLVLIFAVVGALAAPRLLGYDIFAVLSGSMEPTYHVGSVIYVNKKVPVEEIQAGDPITFRVDGETLVTHRVLEVHSDEQEFITQGDANDVPDLAPVQFTNYVGKATMSIPLLGYVAVHIKSKKGMIILAGVFVAFILLQLIPEILKPEDGEEEKRGRNGKK